MSSFKDPIQILEKSPQYPNMFDQWSNHDPEVILLRGWDIASDPKPPEQIISGKISIACLI